jgi:hypothetical protein
MRSLQGVLLFGLTALTYSAVPRVAAPERGDPLKPAPNRRPDEGRGPFKTLRKRKKEAVKK